jgi:hypothetical protein
MAETSDSEELKKLKEQYALMEERLKVEKLSQTQELELVKARIDLFKQILPAGTSKPLEGTTKMDKEFSQIAEQVAYDAMDRAVTKIINNLKNLALGPNPAILIVDKLDIAAGDTPLIDLRLQLQDYSTQIQKQTSSIKDLVQGEEISPAKPETDKMFAPAALAALPIVIQLAPAALSLVSDITGFFRKNYEVAGTKFSLKQEALLAGIAGQLATENRKVYLFNYYLLDDQSGQSELLKKLRELDTQLTDMGKLQIRLATKIHQVNSDSQGKKNKKEWLEEAAAASKSATQLQADITAFLVKIASPDSADKLSKLGQALVRDKIRQLEITHLLYLGVSSSGGGVVTKQGNWASSGATTHIGGVTVIYILSAKDGSIRASGTIPMLCSLEVDLSGSGDHKVREIKI